MGGLNEKRHESHAGSSTGTVEARPSAHQIDDWLGEISDDDWSEPSGRRPGRRPVAAATTAAEPVGDRWSEPAGERSAPAGTVDARTDVERRRIVAGLVLVTVLAVAVGIGVVVARGGETAPTTSAPVTTTPETTETETSSTPTTTAPTDTSTEPTTTTPSDTSTTPSTPGATSFTLPAGTKLRLGDETDPELTAALQRALASAGYDPGPIDGTYGPKTEAAVVAFQQANDLADDGVVGPDTAAALNEALAAG